eukprot:506915-Heterocapsa_arctica.AAC.1
MVFLLRGCTKHLNDSLELGYELSSHMCADICTKGFTDGAKWIEVCDLINIVDPARLRGLIQHVADVVAGIDDIIVDVDKHIPPPCGGDTQHIIASSETPLSATPAVSKYRMYTLSDIDRRALMTIIKDIPH